MTWAELGVLALLSGTVATAMVIGRWTGSGVAPDVARVARAVDRAWKRITR